MDFFTVPTITFGILYCLFVNCHDAGDPAFQHHQASDQQLDLYNTRTHHGDTEAHMKQV
jgi:hypothetical protein